MALFRNALRIISLSSVVILVSCVKTCVGIGELGSKERPVVFALEGWSHAADSIQDFSDIQSCLEDKSGFRTRFEIYPDGPSVVRNLLSRQSFFGILDSASYVSDGMNVGLDARFIAGGSQERFERRSVLIGPARAADSGGMQIAPKAGGSAWSLYLSTADAGIIAYHSQSSTEGFLVPRHMLFELGVFPRGAVFTADWSVTEELVRDGGADIGVLSDDYVRSAWGVDQVHVGLTKDGLSVLAISPPIPLKVLVVHPDSSDKVVLALEKGILACGRTPLLDALTRVFGGPALEIANRRDFDFLRDVIEFQRTFVRVLPQDTRD